MRRLFLFVAVVLAMLIPTRIPPSQMDARMWATWAAAQVPIPSSDLQTFTPASYVGFSVNPSQSMQYADLGSQVLLYFPETLFGTSNATTFELATLPEEIRPSFTREFVFWGLDDGSTYLARANILSTGSITFDRAIVVGSNIQPNTGGWTAAGNKGVKIGTFFLYPK